PAGTVETMDVWLQDPFELRRHDDFEVLHDDGRKISAVRVQHVPARLGRKTDGEKRQDETDRDAFHETEEGAQVPVVLLELEGLEPAAKDPRDAETSQRKYEVDPQHGNPAIERRLDIDERRRRDR